MLPMSLFDNLVSHWKLGEQTGQRMDSWGDNHLTPATSSIAPGDVTAMWGPGKAELGQYCLRIWEANKSLLYLNSETSIQLANTQWGWAFWFLPQDAFSPFIVKNDDFNWSNDYLMEIGQNQQGWVYVGTGPQIRSALTFLPLNLWHLYIAWRDTDGKVWISIDNEAPAGGVAANCTNTTERLEIGFQGQKTAANYNNPAKYGNFYMQSASLWKGRCPTATERAQLWNNGLGLPFSAWPGAPTPTFQIPVLAGQVEQA